MLIRLAEVSENMTLNQAGLVRIQNSEINVESHGDLQLSLGELANARNRCKDANKVVLDLTFRYCQLFILAGCYGQIVRTQTLQERKQVHIDCLKQNLAHNQRLLED